MLSFHSLKSYVESMLQSKTIVANHVYGFCQTEYESTSLMSLSVKLIFCQIYPDLNMSLLDISIFLFSCLVVCNEAVQENNEVKDMIEEKLKEKILKHVSDLTDDEKLKIFDGNTL